MGCQMRSLKTEEFKSEKRGEVTEDEQKKNCGKTGAQTQIDPVG